MHLPGLTWAPTWFILTAMQMPSRLMTKPFPGLPQRMLRYQFGPFLAYFNALRTEDLLALTDYALDRTANSEEALLWRGGRCTGRETRQKHCPVSSRRWKHIRVTTMPFMPSNTCNPTRRIHAA